PVLPPPDGPPGGPAEHRLGGREPLVRAAVLPARGLGGGGGAARRGSSAGLSPRPVQTPTVVRPRASIASSTRGSAATVLRCEPSALYQSASWSRSTSPAPRSSVTLAAIESGVARAAQSRPQRDHRSGCHPRRRA